MAPWRIFRSAPVAAIRRSRGFSARDSPRTHRGRFRRDDATTPASGPGDPRRVLRSACRMPPPRRQSLALRTAPRPHPSSPGSLRMGEEPGGRRGASHVRALLAVHARRRTRLTPNRPALRHPGSTSVALVLARGFLVRDDRVGHGSCSRRRRARGRLDGGTGHRRPRAHDGFHHHATCRTGRHHEGQYHAARSEECFGPGVHGRFTARGSRDLLPDAQRIADHRSAAAGVRPVLASTQRMKCVMFERSSWPPVCWRQASSPSSKSVSGGGRRTSR